MVQVWPKLKIVIVEGGDNSLQILPLERLFPTEDIPAPSGTQGGRTQ